MEHDDRRWHELAAASDALLAAASDDEKLAALGRQIALALVCASCPSIPASELPEELWDEEITRAAVTAELEAGDVFTAWRLGRWALRLTGDERVAVLTRALDAFERLIPTPIGPGNDAGPFCEIADALSEDQTRRALAITARMRAAGWGEEGQAASASLAARLARLGHHAEARIVVADLDESERRWFEEELAGEHPFPAPAIDDAFADLAEWNAWLLGRVGAQPDPRSLVLELTHPWTLRRLVALVGPRAIDVCRAALLGPQPPA